MSGVDALPYPGLRAFRRDESHLFFGRDDCVDQMIDRLEETHFLAVLGPSGSGKSSLVRTGLLSGLDLGLMTEAEPDWEVKEFRPGDQPMANLARALLRPPAASNVDGPDEAAVEALSRRLREGPKSIIGWCLDGNLAEETNLLILLDQFEELFRYDSYAARDEAEAFVALLIESARARAAPIYVVLTMRSDYLGPCALFVDLAEQINAGLYLVRRMTRDEVREAIEGPARICGFSLEPALVHRMVNDLAVFSASDTAGRMDQQQILARRADLLPLMQHVLNELWLDAQSKSSKATDTGPITLRLATYERLGGLRGALNAHAERIFASLPVADHVAAGLLFRALTSGPSIAEAVRRPCRFGDLVALAGGNRSSVAAVVQAFSGPECNFLVTSPPGEINDSTVVDISHESLIRQWNRLGDWVLAEIKSADEYRYLVETAERTDVLQADQLKRALEWRNREHPTEAWAQRYGGDYAKAMRLLQEGERLLQEGEQRLYRKKRNRRVLSLVGGIAVLIAILRGSIFGLGWYHRLEQAYTAQQQAEAMKVRAATEEKLAENYYYEGTALNGTSKAISQSGAGQPSDYSAAMAHFKLAAQDGSPFAPYYIGSLYFHGWGFAKPDYPQAIEWFQKATFINNDPEAENDLGIIYRDGLGVTADPNAALTYFKQAANGRNIDAAVNLAKLYESGLAGAVDERSALKWYEIAAKAGNAEAQNRVGVMLGNGTGTKADLAQALMWLRRSAAQDFGLAEDNLGFMFENGFGVTTDDRIAAGWYRKAADHGVIHAQVRLGDFYWNGIGVALNPVVAVGWYRKAAEQDDAVAEEDLGQAYEQGVGVKKDLVQALDWFLKSADQDDAIAENDVGVFYNNGLGTQKDLGAALFWYVRSANHNNVNAEDNIAAIYADGPADLQNYANAFYWYQQAANAGDPDGENAVGFYYMRGFGVAQNFNLAMTWLKKAAAQNDSVAQNSIGVLYRDGAGVKADCRQAIKWFQLSAAQHNYWGEDDLGGLYARGQCEKQDGALALTYFQKAAQDGYANAYQDINDLAARMMLAKQFAEALKDAKVAITLSPPDDLMAQLEEAEAMMMAGQIDDARSIYLKNMGKPACPGCQAWQDVIKAHFAAMRKQGLSSPLMTEIETAIAAPSAPTAQSHPSPKAP